MDLRRDVVFAAHHGGVASLIGSLDYLLFAEWIVILTASRNVEWDRIAAKWPERVVGLGLAVYGLLGVVGESHWVTMAICGLIAVKLAFQPGARRIGAAVAIVGSRYLADRVKPLNDAWARIDAWAAHGLLTSAGFPSDYHGYVLHSETFAVQIMGGCATSSIFAAVAAAFLIFALCSGAPPRAIARGLALTFGACWIVNLLRLALMVQSSDDFHYWHDGDGKQTVSVAMMAIAYFAASAASRSKTAHAPFDGSGGRLYKPTNGINSA